MHAGQAVVQFAEGVSDRCEYAIKFFLDYDAFLTEAALYAACFPYIRSEVSDDVLARADAAACIAESDNAAVPLSQVAARFVPQVEAVCDGSAGGLEDPRGRWLPPCIVMEKGESLHDWSDRAEPDLFTSLAVCALDPARCVDGGRLLSPPGRQAGRCCSSALFASPLPSAVAATRGPRTTAADCCCNPEHRDLQCRGLDLLSCDRMPCMGCPRACAHPGGAAQHMSRSTAQHTGAASSCALLTAGEAATTQHSTQHSTLWPVGMALYAALCCTARLC